MKDKRERREEQVKKMQRCFENLRKLSKFSKAEFAKMLDVSQEYIESLESGKQTMSFLEYIAFYEVFQTLYSKQGNLFLQCAWETVVLAQKTEGEVYADVAEITSLALSQRNEDEKARELIQRFGYAVDEDTFTILNVLLMTL